MHGELRLRDEIFEKYQIDIRKEWTEAYPHIYYKFKPRYINWEEERIFYANHSSTHEAIYFIIPKTNRTNYDLFCMDKKIRCNCTEIFMNNPDEENKTQAGRKRRSTENIKAQFRNRLIAHSYVVFK